MWASLAPTPSSLMPNGLPRRTASSMFWPRTNNSSNCRHWTQSIYLFDLRDAEAISEQTPLEDLPQEWGAYSLAKRRAGDEALKCLSDSSPSCTIVRPSVVVGRKYDLFSPVGKRMGSILIGFELPKKLLRLMHVDDVAGAISEIKRNDDIYNLSNRGMAQRNFVKVTTAGWRICGVCAVLIDAGDRGSL